MQNLPEETVRFVAASEKLREHVLNYKKPEKFPHHEYELCALERVAVQRGTWFTILCFMYNAALERVPTGDFQCSLTEDAVALGFTKDEACGIMNGWDEASGKGKIFGSRFGCSYDMEAIARGEKLGREMHELSRKQGLL